MKEQTINEFLSQRYPPEDGFLFRIKKTGDMYFVRMVQIISEEKYKLHLSMFCVNDGSGSFVECYSLAEVAHAERLREEGNVIAIEENKNERTDVR